MHIDGWQNRLVIVASVVVLLAGCNATEKLPPAGYFNPESGITLITDPASIQVLGLSDTTVCYTLNSETPTLNNGVCGSNSTALPTDRTLSLTGCGARTVSLLWETPEKKYTTTAQYVLDAPGCNPPPRLIWNESRWNQSVWN